MVVLTAGFFAAVFFAALFFAVAFLPAVFFRAVFFFVAFLEIWGTWVSTWYWEPTVPFLGIGNGNPPSGAAAGYVLFDIAALALAPAALAAWRFIAGRMTRVRDAT